MHGVAKGAAPGGFTLESSEEGVEFRRGEELVARRVEGRHEFVDALLVAILGRLPLLSNERARTPHTEYYNK